MIDFKLEAKTKLQMALAVCDYAFHGAKVYVTECNDWSTMFHEEHVIVEFPHIKDNSGIVYSFSIFHNGSSYKLHFNQDPYWLGYDSSDCIADGVKPLVKKIKSIIKGKNITFEQQDGECCYLIKLDGKVRGSISWGDASCNDVFGQPQYALHLDGYVCGRAYYKNDYDAKKEAIFQLVKNKMKKWEEK